MPEITVRHRISLGTVSRAIKLCGLKARPPFKGPLHHNWKGGTWKDKDGYLSNTEGKKIHRIEGERLLNRTLKIWEDVHHINGVTSDNTPQNLVVMPRREHNRFHTFLRHADLPITKEFLEKLCRRETDHYYRFIKEDAVAASKLYPIVIKWLGEEKIKKKCKIKSCNNISSIKRLCNKHYQRSRAKKRGFWKSGNGRTSEYTTSRM